MTLRTMTRHAGRLLRRVLKLSVVFALPCFAANYEKEIRPLLKEYCLTCHSTEKHKGDLDLERFSSLGEVMKHPKVWQDVAEQMAPGGNAAEGEAATHAGGTRASCSRG